LGALALAKIRKENAEKDQTQKNIAALLKINSELSAPVKQILEYCKERLQKPSRKKTKKRKNTEVSDEDEEKD